MPKIPARQAGPGPVHMNSPAASVPDIAPECPNRLKRHSWDNYRIQARTACRIQGTATTSQIACPVVQAGCRIQGRAYSPSNNPNESPPHTCRTRSLPIAGKSYHGKRHIPFRTIAFRHLAFLGKAASQFHFQMVLRGRFARVPLNQEVQPVTDSAGSAQPRLLGRQGELSAGRRSWLPGGRGSPNCGKPAVSKLKGCRYTSRGQPGARSRLA